ncbi:hypothetical protein BGW41_007375 [Actinomortierella wolfii]|nr:hypothetical protein BGW41_007375 [Actinomortierella wolfii]
MASSPGNNGKNVQEEKLPVVYKAFQEHGIHISLLDHDLERLLDKTHQELAVDVRNDFPSLTPPHTPTTDKQHYPDHDDQLSSSSSIDNNEECDRENRQLEHNCMEQRCPRCHPASGENEHVEVEREKKDQTSDVGDECTQSLTPMTSLEQSLQQEMACRSVAESLRVERLSTAGALLSLPNEELNGIEEALHERHHRHQFQQQQHVCLQDQLSSETMVTPDPIFPSPAASLSSSGEHSRSFIATGQSSSYTQPSPSSYLHHYEKQAIPSQPSYSHKQASSLMLQTSQDVELKRGKGGSSSSASSSATASPTTATAFELRHQAIRTLPENLLRCVGLNTELEMGPPRWMLKIIKILFYEDHVQITRRKCHRMSHSHDSEEEDEASTTTVPRFFSFTATADSVSMITDVAILESEFEEHELFMSLDQCPLRLIRLDLHRFGLDKVGIVQSVARPLTEAGIELLYLSTFSTANILVLEHRLEDAEKILSGMTTPSVHTSS